MTDRPDRLYRGPRRGSPSLVVSDPVEKLARQLLASPDLRRMFNSQAKMAEMTSLEKAALRRARQIEEGEA